MRPYIGITGFMSSVEVSSVLNTVPANPKRLVMVGVLASLKTLRGIKNKYPNRYPVMDKIANIFLDHPLAFNLIHYNSDDSDALGDQLTALTEFGGNNLHGFQLNIAWPSLDVLAEYKKAYPVKQIVLQIGGHAFEAINHSPEQLVEKVAEYDGVVEYMLLDPSGGYGKPFDPERARDYLLALKAKKFSFGLGVAGGLSPTTLNLVEPLIGEFPDLSIDAEGRLRTSEDHLDLCAATEYLCKAFRMFKY